MGILYERTETEDKIIIRYKYLPFLYVLIILTVLVIHVLISQLGILGSCLLIFPLLVVLFLWLDTMKANSEVKKAIKKDRNKVKVLGAKWSFSNPRTVEIPKELLKEEST